MEITPEQREQIQKRQVANALAKLNAGKSITAREQRLIDEVSGDAENYSRSIDDLVRWLNAKSGVSVSRKAFSNWRKKFENFPKPRADRRWENAEVLRFMRSNGLHRADELLGSDLSAEDKKSVRDWKIYREELHCREAERRIARGDNLLLVATDLEIPIGAMLAAINSKLALYPSRTARFMVMKRDVADAEQTLRDEMDAVLKDLNLAYYIEPPIDEVAAELSIDANAIREALRQIGKRVLSNSVEVPMPAQSAKSDQDDAMQCRVAAPVTPARKRAGKRDRDTETTG